MAEQEIHVSYLTPVRSLVPLHNRRGAPLRTVDVERWLRLARTVHRCEKADVLALGERAGDVARFLEPAAQLDLRLSLRTDAASPPPDLSGLLDVFLCPPASGTPHLDAWIEACRAAGMPVRLQWTAPLGPGFDPQAVAERAAAAGAVTVNVAAHDPFVASGRAEAGDLGRMKALVAALRDRGLHADLLRVPFCMADAANRPHVVDAAQFHLMHPHYHREAYVLAAKLYERGPFAAAKSVQILLGRHALWENPIDMRLLPWIVERPWIRARVWAWHKVTRHFRQGTLPRVVEDSAEAYRRAVERQRNEEAQADHPQCRSCCLRRICNRMPEPYRRVFLEAVPVTQAGETVVDPLRFARERRPYFDVLDAARLRRRETWRELAETARATMANHPPDREISPFDYRVENTHSDPVHGGVRWFSFTGTEKLSTPLGRFEPPFTLSAVFGGGIAEHAGFAVGRRARLLCPMTAFSHEITLHTDTHGQYVLLRDGEPVRPVEFEGAYYAPSRLGSLVEPRFALWNIDGEIVTQNVRLWTGADARAEGRPASFSFLIVCTRYSRRLQAALLSIAKQQEVELDSVEVVLAYVPGYDTTEDIIHTMEVAYPNLRIVRSTFSEANAREKGFMINESARLARGEWLVLLDADILVPPDFLRRVEALPEDCCFAAPDGRKMLGDEATADILLGRVEADREWQALLDGPGEIRTDEGRGVPIGYCQIVRTRCMNDAKYDEYGHFEGADWQFGKDMVDRFGPAARLEGLVLLHLHHGGSQWYGTQRHY